MNLFERLQSELKTEKQNRKYSVAISSSKQCDECQKKSEPECDECLECNWCIVSDKYGDKTGTCVLTERFTEVSCANYDENEIVRKKRLATDVTIHSFDIYFPLIVILLSYVMLSSSMIQCTETRKRQIIYYLVSIVALYHMYKFFMKITYKSGHPSTDIPYSSAELDNMKNQKIFILSVSSIISTTISLIIARIFKKCATPFALTFGVFLGILISYSFTNDIEPTKETLQDQKYENNLNTAGVLIMSLSLLLLVSHGNTIYNRYWSI